MIEESMVNTLPDQKVDETPWTIQQTFLGIFLTLVPWVVLSILLTSSRGTALPTTPLPTKVDTTSAVITFILSVLVEGAFLIAPFYFANRALRFVAHRGSHVLRALGFRGFRPASSLSWIVLFFLAFVVVNMLYQDIINTLHLHLQTNDQVILQESKHAPLTTYATLLAAVLIAPICEEIFFRGFVFAGFLRSMPLVWAIILSALLFAVAHADPGSFAVLFFIGLALAFLRWRTRSLWPGILLHLLNNAVGALAIILTMLGIVHS
jgi:membrane protease YdiL (CAAX protease family)